MRVLFLVHSFNSLSQRLFVELTARGHEVSVEFDIHDAVTAEAVRLWRPELVLAPFLKRAIKTQKFNTIGELIDEIQRDDDTNRGDKIHSIRLYDIEGNMLAMSEKLSDWGNEPLTLRINDNASYGLSLSAPKTFVEGT